MATQEYLLRYIEAHKSYDELPNRLKIAITEDEWSKKVKSYCIHKGFSWSGSPAAKVCNQYDYYETLIAFFRSNKRIFPYHLGEFMCRQLRITPFRYYRDLFVDVMAKDQPYDVVPNFTAADALRVVGVGRNEYIAIMQQAKSKKLLWRMNKGIVKDMLPSEPKPLEAENWWHVNVVNISEVEHRSLTPGEMVACRAAARDGGVPYGSLDKHVVAGLYRKDLVWFDVPILETDHVSVPPLEGFVSNKSSVPGEAGDPLETLMYQVFVAASDNITVSKLSSILNVDVATLIKAISIACRLKFCRKLLPDSGESGTIDEDVLGMDASRGMSLRYDARDGHKHAGLVREWSDDRMSPSVSAIQRQQHEASKFGSGLYLHAQDGNANVPPTTSSTRNHDLESILLGKSSESPTSRASLHNSSKFTAQSSPSSGSGVALVVDAEVTGYLMMGALTPAVKKHSVTLFEGGRVYGTAVIEELVSELKESVKLASQFEGQMASLAATAASLAVVLECVKCAAAGDSRAIELLRKESVANLVPPAAFRILAHSYSVIIPVAGLPYPPLPLSLVRSGPTNYGPLPLACTPWMHVALYNACKKSLPSIVIPTGRRLSKLPALLVSCDAALVWPWSGHAVRAGPTQPIVLDAASVLVSLNSLLSKTAVLVQPLFLKIHGSVGGPTHSRLEENLPRRRCSIDTRSGIRDYYSISQYCDVVFVDLPLPLHGVQEHNPTDEDTTTTTAAATATKGYDAGGNGVDTASHWAPEFQDNATTPGTSTSMRVQGFTRSGSSRLVDVPMQLVEALSLLGVDHAIGSFRVLLLSHEPPREPNVSMENSYAEKESKKIHVEVIPIQLIFGMPLYPRELCQAVCRNATSRSFLSRESCIKQNDGQRSLDDTLKRVAIQHGMRMVGVGDDDDLASDIVLPMHGLYIDKNGVLERVLRYGEGDAHGSVVL